MQHSELLVFLNKNTSPEQTYALMAAANILSEKNVYTHEIGIQNTMSAISNSDIPTTLSTIEHLLITTLLDELYTMGIEVTDVPLSVLSDIYKATFDVDNYGDPDAFINICDALITSEEKFAEIVSYLAPYHVEDLVPYFAKVSNAVIDRIKGICVLQSEDVIPLESDAVEQAIITTARERLQHYRTIYPQALVYETIRNGLTLGRHHDDYIEIVREQLEAFEYRILPKEIYGLLLASDTPSANFSATGEAILTEFIADDRALISAVQQLNSLSVS